MARRKTRKESAEVLARLAREGMAKVSPMTQWERKFEEEARQRGQQEMDQRLSELPAEDGRPKSCPRCGKRARVRARAVPRTFKSLWGKHTISRDYHFCEECKEGFYPRDEFLGLPKQGELTEEVESRVADFAVNDVYEAAAARWRFHYRLLPVSENQFRQVARRLGEQVETSNQVLVESAVRPPPEAESARLYVMADGGMVPMIRGQWREVKVGVFFREENHLPSSDSQRGLISEARYTAVVGSQEDFKAQMRAAWQVENAHRAHEVVWLSDGAPENWVLASVLCPSAAQVLDWCHAVEAGMRCGKALLGEMNVGLVDWKNRVEQLLASGDVSTLLEELRACWALTSNADERTAVEVLLRYYETNRERMAYADFRQRGWLIGSGAVESAHRHVIQTRMKKAGQHWSERGARQMARLRAAYRTAGPDKFYAAVRWAYRNSLRTERLVPKPFKADLRRRIFSAN
jgi:hypothetical protein